MNVSFFTNTACPYYPCHNEEEINCMFCYCPLYERDCPGSPVYLENGKKDCSLCTFPHKKENYGRIMEMLKSFCPFYAVMQKNAVINLSPCIKRLLEKGAVAKTEADAVVLYTNRQFKSIANKNSDNFYPAENEKELCSILCRAFNKETAVLCFCEINGTVYITEKK